MLRVATALLITLSVLAGCGTAAAQPDTVRSNGTTIEHPVPGDSCRALREPARGDCYRARLKRQAEINAWWAEVRAQQRRAADAAWRARVEAYFAALRRAEAARRAQQGPAGYAHGQCGGSLPPCYVMMRESRGDIHAQNPRSSASGKWQFLDSTWARHRGYAKARYAPEWVQDEKARILWAGGRGCSHWSACGRR